MFARVVSATLNPSKANEFRSTVTGQIENTLRSQPGFLELISLTSESDSNKVIAVSIWRTRQDAEKYESATASRVLAQVKPFVSEIKVDHYTVDTGTGKKIATAA
ncbi:MAG: antibiotic biosynthesis monooxygenase [Acidobacteria bacterium]|nr:antibiotic biosynthesis monooxygenase [Acidobacteriota bacterium]